MPSTCFVASGGTFFFLLPFNRLRIVRSNRPAGGSKLKTTHKAMSAVMPRIRHRIYLILLGRLSRHRIKTPRLRAGQEFVNSFFHFILSSSGYWLSLIL
mmetsp:Transcript_1615/g.3095  ORF Transcript_1615/g.3095 Transcript_1615/m.3095 type:complete len:99 (+) Transcript_1615:770-1066(+)